MAMVQVRRPTAGQAYYRRKLAEGKSPKEALRCLGGGCRTPSTAACSPIRPATAAPPSGPADHPSQDRARAQLAQPRRVLPQRAGGLDLLQVLCLGLDEG
jgi:hypothetical protein